MHSHCSSPKGTGLCLVFPPVWLPMVPHPALPVLPARLRRMGAGVVTLDARRSE